MQSNVTSLAGRHGIVFGVASKRSIAWAIAQAWHDAGAKLAFTYQGERLKENVEELAGTFGADTLIAPCDVRSDAEIERFFAQVKERTDRIDLLLHSVAFAPPAAAVTPCPAWFTAAVPVPTALAIPACPALVAFVTPCSALMFPVAAWLPALLPSKIPVMSLNMDTQSPARLSTLTFVSYQFVRTTVMSSE